MYLPFQLCVEGRFSYPLCGFYSRYCDRKVHYEIHEPELIGQWTQRNKLLGGHDRVLSFLTWCSSVVQNFTRSFHSLSVNALGLSASRISFVSWGCIAMSFPFGFLVPTYIPQGIYKVTFFYNVHLVQKNHGFTTPVFASKPMQISSYASSKTSSKYPAVLTRLTFRANWPATSLYITQCILSILFNFRKGFMFDDLELEVGSTNNSMHTLDLVWF